MELYPPSLRQKLWLNPERECVFGHSTMERTLPSTVVHALPSHKVQPEAYDIYFPTEPDLSKIWKFVKNLIKNYISENLIKKYIDIFAVFKITKKILKNYFKNTECTASRCRWYLKCNFKKYFPGNFEDSKNVNVFFL